MSHSRSLALATFVGLIMFALGLNTTALYDMLTAMKNTFGFSTLGIQWLVNSYMLAITVMILAGGKLCDFFSKKWLFILSCMGFCIACVIVGLGFTSWVVFLGRVLQGITAAAVLPASLAVLKVYIPEASQVTAFGLWSALLGLGFASGPTLGGLITVFAGWRYVFFLTALLGVMSFLMVLFLAPVGYEQKNEKFALDFLGLVFFVAGTSAFVIGFMQGQVWGWLNIATLICLLCGLFLVYAFFVWQGVVKTPLWSLSVFKNTHLLASSLGNIAYGIGVAITLNYLLLFFQNPFLADYSALIAGLALLPFSLAVFAISLGMKHLRLWLPNLNVMLVFGFACLIIAYVWFYFISAHSGYAFLIVPIIIAGLGVGTLQSNLPKLAADSVQPKKMGEAVGVNWTVFYLATVIAITVSGITYDVLWRHQFMRGLNNLNNVPVQVMQALASPKASMIGLENALPNIASVKALYAQATVTALNDVMLFFAFVILVVAMLTLFLSNFKRVR